MVRFTSSGVEQRQRRLVLRESLAIGVVGFFFLIVGRIQQQQFAKRLGGGSRIDRASKSILHESRQVADVVDVSMRQHDGVDVRRIERQSLPVLLRAVP